MDIQIVECPDLTAAPFHLAAPGLRGNETIVEFGAVPYLLPLVDMSKVYDLKTMLGKVTGKDLFAIGAGAGQAFLKHSSKFFFNIRYFLQPLSR